MKRRIPRFSPIGAFLLTPVALIVLSSAAGGADTASLVRRLESGSRDEQLDACRELAKMGAAARPAVAALIGRTKPGEPWEVRWNAIDALKAVGGEPSEIVAALKDIPGESGTEWRVRRSAATALARLGDGARDAVPTLIEEIRLAVNPEERHSVQEVLGVLGVGPEHVEPLRRLLRMTGDDWAREVATGLLSQIGKDARGAVGEVLELLKGDKSSKVKAAAIEALKSMGIRDGPLEGNKEGKPHSGPVFGALWNALSDGDKEIRRAAVDASARLFTFNVDGADLSQGDFSERYLAFLRRSGDEKPVEVSWEVRRAAVIAIGSLDKAPKGALECLLDRVDYDKQWQVREAAIDAVVRQIQAAAGPNPPDQQALIGRLIARIDADNSWEVRRAAAIALGELHADPSILRAVLPLLSLLKADKPGEVRRAAAAALARIGLDVEAIAAKAHQGKDGIASMIRGGLLEAMDAEDRLMSRSASEAIATMGEWSLPTLEAIVKDGDEKAVTNPRMLIGAVRALGLMKFDRKAEAGVEGALPRLVDLCRRANADEASAPKIKDVLLEARAESRRSLLTIIKDLHGLEKPQRTRNAIRAVDAAIAIGTPTALADARDAVPSSGAWNDPDVGREVLDTLKAARDRLAADVRPGVWQERVNLLSSLLAGIAKYFLYVVGIAAVLAYILCVIYWRISPLARIRASERLASDLRFNVKLFGFEVNTGEILRLVTFTKFGGSSTNSLDAWVASHVGDVKKAFEGWRVGGDGGPIGVDLADGISPDPVPTPDDLALAKEFEKTRISLLIGGGDRSQQDRLLRKISLRAVGDGGDAPLSSHRMLPVVVALHDGAPAMGQDVLIDAVRGRLRVLLDLVDPPSQGLVEALMRRSRVLLILTASPANIDALREIVEGPSFPANAVIVVLRPGGGAIPTRDAGDAAVVPPVPDPSSWSSAEFAMAAPRLVRPSRVVIAPVASAEDGAY